MGDKSVPSSAGGGPRDFSDAVHGNFTQAPPAAPDTSVCLIARVYLGEGEAGKVSPDDVLGAVAELMARQGVDMGSCLCMAFQAGDLSAVASAGRMPR